MSTETSPYNARGCRLVDGVEFYPYWKIQVHNTDVISPDVHVERIGAANACNIRTRMSVLATQYPDHSIQLTASARVRLWIKNEKVYRENRLTDFCHINKVSPQEIAIFDDMLCADRHGHDTYIIKEA